LPPVRVSAVVAEHSDHEVIVDVYRYDPKDEPLPINLDRAVRSVCRGDLPIVDGFNRGESAEAPGRLRFLEDGGPR
jgi:hypothetical protein